MNQVIRADISEISVPVKRKDIRFHLDDRIIAFQKPDDIAPDKAVCACNQYRFLQIVPLRNAQSFCQLGENCSPICKNASRRFQFACDD